VFGFKDFSRSNQNGDGDTLPDEPAGGSGLDSLYLLQKRGQLIDDLFVLSDPPPRIALSAGLAFVSGS
jgi:hypothetical protein